LTRNEIVATAIALGAVAVVTVSDLNLSSTYFVGDLLAFGSMLFYALYMALGRRNRHHPTVWLYLVPLYAVAAVTSLIVAVFFVNPFAQTYTARELLLILGLGIIPTVIGHSLVNVAMKHFRGQIVSIINMGQFVFAGLMAFLLWGEVPEATFFLAAAMLAVAAYVAVGAKVRLPGIAKPVASNES
jgi:drug/metabolite transporter (DMT)-like permease